MVSRMTSNPPPRPPSRRISLPEPPGPFRFVGAVFGFVFGGIGVCFLFLMWGGDSDFVPVAARIFGSLIAMAFVAFGGVMIFTSIKGSSMASIELPDIADAPRDGAAPPTVASSVAGYVCPRCGAALGAKADVSPMGDVKCPFCGQWFNVHGKASG